MTFEWLGLQIESPLWLWLLVPAGVVIVLLSGWFAVMSGVRRWVSVGLRLLLLALIALTLSQASRVTRSDRVAVVAVVDQSESVRRFGSLGEGAFEARVRALLSDGLRGRDADDLFAIVEFGARATVTRPPGAARGEVPELSYESPGATNLEQAIVLARSLIPSDAAGRIVVFSDGNQTRGDALRAALSMAAASSRVPIDVVPLRYALENEVAVTGVDAPAVSAQGASLRLRVTLTSTGEAAGVLRVFGVQQDDRSLVSETITLRPGENVRVIDAPLSAGRVHRFRVVFEPATDSDGRMLGDTLVDNNAAGAFTLTPGGGSVLVVQGESETGASSIATALRDDGLRVEEVSSRLLPLDPLTLQGFDLVVLENVGADEVDPAAQALLAAGVRDMGLGLVMVGGPASFGAGGWRNTALEPILPVLLDLPERAVIPESAVVFILDSSGSMRRGVMGSSRSQQEIANQAAAMALGALDRRDLIGVIAFASEHRIVRPLAPNTDPAQAASAILSIASGGGTNLAPAMIEAARMLESVEAKNRQVVVLTDGVSQDRERLPEIAKRLASQSIRVSAISIGDDADSKGLEELAKIGGGEFFQVVNPSVLPRIFMRAISIVRSPLIREEPFSPVTVDPTSPALQGLGALPSLLGLTLTQARPESTVVNAVTTPAGEPVLSHWRVELGQVAAFTSDAGRWAEPWRDWPGFDRFWSQLARSMSRGQETSGLIAEASARDGRFLLRVRGETREMEGLRLPASVFSPSGRVRELTLSEVGPGEYEASLPLGDEEGPSIAVVRPMRDGVALPAVVAGATVVGGEEKRSLRSDDVLLARLARETGGRVLDLDAEQIPPLFAREGLSDVRARRPLWPALLLWIPLLLWLDIACRRVAWDRWIGRERIQATTASARSVAAALTERVKDGPDVAASYSGVALSPKDADLIAAAARDRRRAELLRNQEGSGLGAGASESRSEPAPISAAPTQREPEEGGSGLLAAKRRAQERFNE